MPLPYNAIVIFTSESAKCQGKPVADAVLQHVRAQKIAARCIVTRGVGGCYESGEVATQRIVDISVNMPLKIEIVLPAPELDRVLPGIEAIVTDGIVVVENIQVRSHRISRRLLPRHLRIRDAMTPTPVSVASDTPVSDVIRLLLSSSFNGVPVVDAERRPIGIVTQGDLIRRAGMPVRLGLLQEAGREGIDALLRSLPRKTAREIMSQPVVTVGADKPLTEAVDLMLHRKLKRLPVVDEEGKLAGMLARLDVFRTITAESPDWQALARRNVALADARFVRDVMRRDTHTARPDTPLEQVMKVIDANDIQRVAVVDAAGKLLGLISDRDLFAALSDRHGGVWDYLMSKVSFGEAAQRRKEWLDLARARTAADVMREDLVTVREDTPLDEAAHLMTEHELKRLPVLDAQGRFAGMVSRDSLLRAARLDT